MTTVEKINGIDITIEWSFHEKLERHDSNWCEWSVYGNGNDGVQYIGLCQADGNHPYDFHSDVTDVETLDFSETF